MTSATTAEKIRERSLKIVTVNGLDFLVRRPGLKTMIEAGARRLTFSHEKKTPRPALKDILDDPEKLLKHYSQELEFYARLCHFCMVKPRLFDGPTEERPADSVTLEMIEDEYATIGKAILEFAGMKEAISAAKAAEAFRADAGGEADRDRGEVLPDPPVDAPQGELG